MTHLFVTSSPRSFFGVEDFLDDDNSRPFTYKKEKKSKIPQKHISVKQQTVAYMEPFTLDVFISKRFVSASLTHRVTCKQVAVAGTNSKDIKTVLKSHSDSKEQEKLMFTRLCILQESGISLKGRSELLFSPS
ncbi:hypothetical protein GIB67_035034 [Kingdonia uniflora]|uniref:Uncharacterized protein n=1 Tax=Kingdonia uniflora TaxID=39325 RepID=A0A7J7L1H1_9MAGN|nr:hypothetical protein GIB67_035034 [Kingdonia uniflora]